MNNKRNVIITLSMVTSLALSAMANEETLGEVTVHDTAFEAHIKTMTSEKLDLIQATDVKDILDSLPSVNVTGSSRYSQKVYVRGLEDKFSNITIDGARMTGQLFHHSGDQTIDAEMLKIGSIELGPNSALSGPGVVNGSFVYETKDPSDLLEEGKNFGGKISVGHETGYNRNSANLSLFGKVNEKVELLGIANVVDDGEIETPAGNVKDKESKLESGLLKSVFKLNDNNTLKLSFNRYNDGGGRNISAEKGNATEVTDNDFNEITRDTYTVNYEYNPDNDLIKIDAKLFYNSQEMFREKADTFDQNNVKSGQSGDRYYENTSEGFDLRNTSIFGNHMLTYGIDYSKDEQTKRSVGDQGTYYSSRSNTDIANSNNINGSGTLTSQGLYVEDEISLGALVLNVGARYDMFKLGGWYSGDFSKVTPKFKSKYQVNDELSLRFAYGRIFKAPALPETLTLSQSDIDSWNANGVKAQEGHNYEAGFDYDLSEVLDADDAIFGFTAYTYNVDNYSHPTKNNALAPQYDVNVYGVESVFKYNKDKLGLSLSHSYSDGSEKSLSDGSKKDPKTAKIHSFKTGVDYSFTDALKVAYSAQFVLGNTYAYKSNQMVSRSGYAVHNINSTYKISEGTLKGATVNFGIDNIFDKQYAQHTAFGVYFDSETYTDYEVGRNFKVKLSYKF